MITETMQRAQAYKFFAGAFLYPTDDWLADLSLVEDILCGLGAPPEAGEAPQTFPQGLDALQREHRNLFGLTGSLFYETELGLPHEFRQSQELADIAGFYRAFGFQSGGAVRERPDHLASELEFMYALAVKQAYAAANNMPEQAEICADAQGKFVQDHLGRWIGAFRRSLERSTSERLGEAGLESPYVRLARLAEAFLGTEARRLGVEVQQQPENEQRLTPFNPDFTCAGCAAAETSPV